VKKISLQPTLRGSRELKIWYFTTKFLPQLDIYVNNTWSKFQGQKIHHLKVIQNLPTWIVVEFFSLLPTFTASQGLEFFFFAMKFFEQKLIYDFNTLSKFQVQKISTKKDIHNLPTCIVLRNTCGNHFTTTNFGTPPRAKKLSIYREFFVTQPFLC